MNPILIKLARRIFVIVCLLPFNFTVAADYFSICNNNGCSNANKNINLLIQGPGKEFDNRILVLHNGAKPGFVIDETTKMCGKAKPGTPAEKANCPFNDFINFVDGGNLVGYPFCATGWITDWSQRKTTCESQVFLLGNAHLMQVLAGTKENLMIQLIRDDIKTLREQETVRIKYYYELIDRRFSEIPTQLIESKELKEHLDKLKEEIKTEIAKSP